MKKLYRLLILAFVIMTTSSALTAPFISTDPCARVEYYQVNIENNETKEKFDTIIIPQTDDSLISDLVTDLTVTSKDADLKITIVATNSDGNSPATSFNLKISTVDNITSYKIEPIPEEDNPSYLDKYVADQLEIEMKENNNTNDGGGGGGGGGCFITTARN